MSSIVFKDIEKFYINDVVKLIRSEFKKEYLEKTIFNCSGIGEYLNISIENKFTNKYRTVCLLDKEIVGYIEFIKFQKMIHINYLVVSSKYQRKSIGKKLILHALRKFKDTEFIELYVDSKNDKAKKFYLNLGFKELKRKNLFEIKIEESKDNFNNFILDDYEKYKMIYDKFGFSEINIRNLEKIYKVGVLGEEYYQIYNEELIDNKEIINFIKSFDKKRKLIVWSENYIDGLKMVDYKTLMQVSSRDLLNRK